MQSKRVFGMVAGVVLAAITAAAADTYPVPAWPSDATVQNLNGGTDQSTGMPYIARGTSPSSTPPLQIQIDRREARANEMLAAANQLRLVKESTALKVGVYPGDYMMNGARAHFAGATNQSVPATPATYYAWIDNANALQIDAAWPEDVSQFVPLADITVSSGSITAIVDRRGYAETVIPQTAGAATTGTDSTFYILDQDNGGAGVDLEYRFNRGSSGDDAALRWDETAAAFAFLADCVTPAYGAVKGLKFESTVATGVAPFSVASTTVCASLNSDRVDGVDIAGGGSLAAGGVTYASGTAGLAVTAAGTAGQVLLAGGASAPTWTTIGSAGGVLEGWDADLDAFAGLSGTGLVARTGVAAAALRTITAGSSIAVADGDGATGNPTISVSGATEYAVQIGAADGSLANVSLGTDNTALVGRTGDSPTFRKLVEADIDSGARIQLSKIERAAGSGEFIISDDSGVPTYRAIYGDVDINDEGYSVLGLFQYTRSESPSADGMTLMVGADGEPGWRFSCAVESLATSQSLTQVQSDSVVHNTDSTGLVTLTLPNFAEPGLAYRFVVTSANGIKIATGTTTLIRLAASTTTSTTGYVESTTVGSALTLVCVPVPGPALQWIALMHEGTWAVN